MSEILLDGDRKIVLVGTTTIGTKAWFDFPRTVSDLAIFAVMGRWNEGCHLDAIQLCGDLGGMIRFENGVNL